MRSLDTLFTPRAVAILGASNDETKYGNWISVQALRMRAAGRSTWSTVAASRCWAGPAFRRLADMPEPVDSW